MITEHVEYPLLLIPYLDVFVFWSLNLPPRVLLFRKSPVLFVSESMITILLILYYNLGTIKVNYPTHRCTAMDTA